MDPYLRSVKASCAIRRNRLKVLEEEKANLLAEYLQKAKEIDDQQAPLREQIADFEKFIAKAEGGVTAVADPATYHKFLETVWQNLRKANGIPEDIDADELATCRKGFFLGARTIMVGMAASLQMENPLAVGQFFAESCEKEIEDFLRG